MGLLESSEPGQAALYGIHSEYHCTVNTFISKSRDSATSSRDLPSADPFDRHRNQALLALLRLGASMVWRQVLAPQRQA